MLTVTNYLLGIDAIWQPETIEIRLFNTNHVKIGLQLLCTFWWVRLLISPYANIIDATGTDAVIHPLRCVNDIWKDWSQSGTQGIWFFPMSLNIYTDKSQGAIGGLLKKACLSMCMSKRSFEWRGSIKETQYSQHAECTHIGILSPNFFASDICDANKWVRDSNKDKWDAQYLSWDTSHTCREYDHYYTLGLSWDKVQDIQTVEDEQGLVQQIERILPPPVAVNATKFWPSRMRGIWHSRWESRSPSHWGCGQHFQVRQDLTKSSRLIEEPWEVIEFV